MGGGNGLFPDRRTSGEQGSGDESFVILCGAFIDRSRLRVWMPTGAGWMQLRVKIMLGEPVVCGWLAGFEGGK
jgi:hypothetical protein